MTENLILDTVSTLWLAWLAAGVLEQRFARGTRGRYVARSLGRPLRYMALANPIAVAFYGSAVVAGFLFVAWLALMWLESKWRRDDDDDFWSDLSKKARRWVRSIRVSAPVVAPAGV